MGLIYGPLFLMMILGAMSQTKEIVHGVQGTNVLLPCSCDGRNLEKEFKWCINEKKNSTLYLYQPNEEPSTTRVKAFWKESSSNCSILLKNITENDNVTYRCSFFEGNAYKYQLINLEIIPPSTSPSTSVLPVVDSPSRIVENTSRKHFIIIPIVTFLLIMGCLCKTYLKQRRNTLELTQQESEVV